MGTEYWNGLRDFIQGTLVEEGTIDLEDLPGVQNLKSLRVNVDLNSSALEEKFRPTAA